MSVRERFFKKVQQNNVNKPIHINTAEAEVRAFCQRMDDLAQQIIVWFEGSVIPKAYHRFEYGRLQPQ